MLRNLLRKSCNQLVIVALALFLSACEGTVGENSLDGQATEDGGAGDLKIADAARDSEPPVKPDQKVKQDKAPQDQKVKQDKAPPQDQKVKQDKAPPPDQKVKQDKAIPPGLLLSDPLTGKGVVKGEKGKWVKGGKFSTKGWQSTTGQSQIMIQLKTTLKTPGTLKIDVTNFDPLTQIHAAKHEIINMYTQANGSKKIFNTKGSWWNIRTGTNYTKDPMDIKFLSALNGKRHETRIKNMVTLNKSKTYTFMVKWAKSGISIYLDNQKVHTHSWGTMVESWEYVFIGTNNVYTGQKGPIYSNLRIYNY